MCALLILFVLLHLFNISFLWHIDVVMPIVFMGLAPVLFFLFFNYRVIKGINRDTIGQNKSFNAFALKFFSFIFLKLGFAMPVIVQISFILSQ
jgi:Na+/H+ antiporter NhaD/arsenite permease-like protein